MVADIGGTNARFATLGATARDLGGIEVLRCADYRSIGDAIDHYRRVQGIESISEVCLAVAGPTDRDRMDPPNNPWAFSCRALERELGAPLTVINDFTAQARCIDALHPGDLTWLGAPRPPEHGIRAVLGPGTGLGVAVETLQGEIIPSEGGHAGFAPANAEEVEVLRLLMSRFGRVSAERLLSGPGLENLCWAHRQMAEPGGRVTAEGPSAAEIAGLAAEGDPSALRSIGSFFDILATFAGDVALFAWATGGVYLTGGVMHRLAGFLDPGRFRARFEEKGRFSRFCETVPVAWINHDLPGLLGCAAALHAPRAGAGHSEAIAR